MTSWSSEPMVLLSIFVVYFLDINYLKLGNYLNYCILKPNVIYNCQIL